MGVINLDNFVIHMSQIGNYKNIFKKKNGLKKVPENGFEIFLGLKF